MDDQPFSLVYTHSKVYFYLRWTHIFMLLSFEVHMKCLTSTYISTLLTNHESVEDGSFVIFLFLAIEN